MTRTNPLKEKNYPKTLQERDSDAVWHPFTPLRGRKAPVPIVGAKGTELYTEDGRTIIDAIASWWVNLHGHAHPYIAEAVARQVKSLEHVIFADFTHEPAVKLAERLLEILPKNQDKVFFSDNGSTAVEVALKMALQYWYNQASKRTKVIALEGAYHGDTFGAMSVGGRGPFTDPYGALLFETIFIPFPDEENKEVVLRHFQEAVSKKDVAAFIFEPLMQGASGMRMYPAEVLDQLIGVAREHDVLCIADEVMTGFGRTGKPFASDYLEHKPDIFCLSKGLTGGTMALGVTTCTQEVLRPFESAELLKTFFHGHSFTANPVACAAANASLDLLLTETCFEHIRFIEQKHHEFTHRVRSFRNAKNVRVLGTILAIEIETLEETSYFNEAGRESYAFFMDRGVLLRPLGNVVYVLPPYCINEDELEKVYGAIEAFLSSNRFFLIKE